MKTFEEIMKIVSSADDKKAEIIRQGKEILAALNAEEAAQEFTASFDIHYLYEHGTQKDGHHFCVARDIYEPWHLLIICHGKKGGGICAAQNEGDNAAKISAALRIAGVDSATTTKISLFCCYGGYNKDINININGHKISVTFFNREKRVLWHQFYCDVGEVGMLNIYIDTPRCEQLRQLRRQLLDAYYSL